jgi:hypothetical protein
MASLPKPGEHLETQDSPSPSIAGSTEMMTLSGRRAHADLAQQPMASEVLSDSLSSSDPDNPMNWPLYRKVYVSSCGFLFAASV